MMPAKFRKMCGGHGLLGHAEKMGAHLFLQWTPSSYSKKAAALLSIAPRDGKMFSSIFMRPVLEVF